MRRTDNDSSGDATRLPPLEVALTELEPAAATPTSPDEEVRRSQEEAEALALLDEARLTAAEREVALVLLHREEGETQAQVAARLGAHPVTFRVHVRNVRQKIRRAM